MENEKVDKLPAPKNEESRLNESGSGSKGKESTTILALNKIKKMACTRAFHKTLLQEGISVGFAVLSLGSDTEEAVNVSLDILHLLAQYPENRTALSSFIHIFDALQSVIDNQSHGKELRERARWISSILKEKGLELRRDKKSKRKPLGEKSRKPSTKTERAKKNSKNVYLRIVDVCVEANRNEITDTLRKIEGIISITYVVPKSVCLILSHVRVPSEVYGKAVANMGYECDLVAWDSNNEEVWLKQYPDKWDISKNITGKENEPEYLPDSDDEKDKSIGDMALVPEGQIPKEKAGGGWFSSAANFLQNSFYW